jgi:outer membrane protein OmpA-like peptidoglycan-associated protein
LAIWLLGQTAALALEPDWNPHVGAHLGGAFTLDDWALTDAQAGSPQARHAGLVGGRLGVNPWRRIGLEAGLDVLPLWSTDGWVNLAFHYTGDVLLHLRGPQSGPFLDLGLGAHHSVSGDLGTDLDQEFHWGLGFKTRFLETLPLRLEVRHLLVDGVEKGLGHQLQVSLGVDWFWSAPKRAVAPAPPLARPCPVLEPQVEPEPEPVEVPPPAPEPPPAPAAQPPLPSPPIVAPAPVAKEKFSGVLQGITFRVGTVELEPASLPVLDDAARILLENPALRVRITGHTDSLWVPEANLVLSKRRAEAVRDYLVSKGIDRSRLEATGRGETQPIQDNGTREGRAANRRIEFTIIK